MTSVGDDVCWYFEWLRQSAVNGFERLRVILLTTSSYQRLSMPLHVAPHSSWYLPTTLHHASPRLSSPRHKTVSKSSHSIQVVGSEDLNQTSLFLSSISTHSSPAAQIHLTFPDAHLTLASRSTQPISATDVIRTRLGIELSQYLEIPLMTGQRSERVVIVFLTDLLPTDLDAVYWLAIFNLHWIWWVLILPFIQLTIQNASRPGIVV